MSRETPELMLCPPAILGSEVNVTEKIEVVLALRYQAHRQCKAISHSGYSRVRVESVQPLQALLFNKICL